MSEPAVTTLRTFLSSTGLKRFIVGLWLTALYFVCISMVVFSLSTYLFQDKLNSLLKPNNHDSSGLMFAGLMDTGDNIFFFGQSILAFPVLIVNVMLSSIVSSSHIDL